MDVKRRSEPAQPQWIGKRDKLVQQALEDNDLAGLRRLSALPGGFGSQDMRQKVWPKLLHTEKHFDSRPLSEDEVAGPSRPRSKEPDASERCETPIHPDENQVDLDTKRSFVTYPRGIPKESKLTMQAELHDLIIHVIRKYPSLSYFQGFHDIMSTLYLTFIPLPPGPHPRGRSTSARSRAQSRDTSRTNSRNASPARHLQDGQLWDAPRSTDQSRSNSPRPLGGRETERYVTSLPGWQVLLQCAEVISVCRVRDAMGKGLDPMMGLLKILKRVLRVADPELDHFSATISPVPTLPFFALSWILCLFSHDIDTLEPVQRMFDFLLARNPISAIYLAVAILMAKKKQMFALAEKLGAEGLEDPSLLHPLFARLPPLYPDTLEHPNPPVKGEAEKAGLDMLHEEANPYDPIPLSRIFDMTDDLLARYPWDGPKIRGHEIMGPQSVVRTYAIEGTDELDLSVAQTWVESQVVLPGATEPDEEQPLLPPRRRSPLGLGTALAAGVLVLGIGIAVYSASGERSGWRRWWMGTLVSWWKTRRASGLDYLQLLRDKVGRLL
ncbi:hypothetical protein BD324DRAFT_618319 [Kockovaella imperatae]|uniref:Rab-GAP TBC domain-containing protein n=1 Tax=Kockovaella imperatae TaxID=4999 RepID=A0A1Y1UM17_9TREE|nr:hypothetical protein BD324DRAFT_618319 [Kockovaella imperatae]ORX39039.1 hypothetical protein BD324DRAFT_618319 [Kockovaella imperatae]